MREAKQLIKHEETVKLDVKPQNLGKISKRGESEQVRMLVREAFLEEDSSSEDFESDFEAAYSKALREFTREVVMKLT